MNIILLLIFIGFIAGVLSGMFGIGGGIILVPAMVFFLKYDQRAAQGTTLFMLMLPVVALGVWKYYQEGKVEIQSALMLAVGFVFGAFFGAKIANSLPNQLTVLPDFTIHQPMKKLFGVLMIIMAVRLLLAK